MVRCKTEARMGQKRNCVGRSDTALQRFESNYTGNATCQVSKVLFFCVLSDSRSAESWWELCRSVLINRITVGNDYVFEHLFHLTANSRLSARWTPTEFAASTIGRLLQPIWTRPPCDQRDENDFIQTKIHKCRALHGTSKTQETNEKEVTNDIQMVTVQTQ